MIHKNTTLPDHLQHNTKTFFHSKTDVILIHNHKTVPSFYTLNSLSGSNSNYNQLQIPNTPSDSSP